jgi:hypothetical protein
VDKASPLRDGGVCLTFVFISHAQPDKFRPDGRLRQLAHYLHQAGIPLWLDRPEELGLSARELKDRCIHLSGIWTNDIRTALRECAAGVGIWSLHSRQRLSDDANGVLFQELNVLNVHGNLYLTSIDPGIAGDVSESFKNLSVHQHVIDLGALELTLFASRFARLVEALSTTTKVKPARVRPYIAVLANSGRGGAMADLLRPEWKRAREAASRLLAAFAVHDPGRLQLALTPQLAAAYARTLEICKRDNKRCRTYHLVLAMMQMPSRFVHQCFDKLEVGLGTRIEQWLTKKAEQQSESYLDIDSFTDTLASAASALAEAECASAIDERHSFLAVLQGTSGTVSAISRSIGEQKFRVLIRIACHDRPEIPAITPTPLSGLDGL